MSESTSQSSRREFIKTTGRVAAVSALAGMTLPYVHAAGDETLQVALIGCGGRGGGAAQNALRVKRGPMKLVAMADVFTNRLEDCHNGLSNDKTSAPHMDVPPERRFIGFDGYQHAMDCLKQGDIAIFTTPLAFRWVHFTYAIQKGLNVFMEKPLTADGPSSRKMLKLAEEASAKNLKVGVGLMCRHHRPLQELAQRAQDGQLGEIILMRGYRMAPGELAACFSEKWPGDPSELLWQIRRFHSFIWASGGLFSDFYIHHIDHLCMIKNAWPVKAQALGGRHYRTSPGGAPQVDQNFDHYAVEYTFLDGTKMYIDGRNETKCEEIYSSYVHGSKGMAIAASSGDYSPPSSIFSTQKPNRAHLVWTSKDIPGEEDPYDNEWNDLVAAIRDDKPYNEVPRGIQASVTTSMGRMAAHTGVEITYDEMLNHEDTYAPGVENYTMDSPPPLRSGPDGKYPIPMPGLIGKHEFKIDKLT
jgi:predicted dehydrogenase